MANQNIQGHGLKTNWQLQLKKEEKRQKENKSQ